MKPIRLEDTVKIQELGEEQLRKAIEKMVNCQEKVTITLNLNKTYKDLPKYKEKAVINFTMKAWCQLTFLTGISTIEVAAHAITEQVSEKEFLIKEFLMYPQMANAGAVDAVDGPYEEWLFGLDDETFNNLRGQYHSHVRMPTKPSSTDSEFYQTILKGVDDYYIFMIFNKAHEMYWEVYDVTNNIMYETKDILLGVIDLEGNDLEADLESAIDLNVTPFVYAGATNLYTGAAGTRAGFKTAKEIAAEEKLAKNNKKKSRKKTQIRQGIETPDVPDMEEDKARTSAEQRYFAQKEAIQDRRTKVSDDFDDIKLAEEDWYDRLIRLQEEEDALDEHYMDTVGMKL